MMTQEPRRRAIPGRRECINAIKAISDSMATIENEIKECYDKIAAIMESILAKNDKARLRDDLRGITEEIKALKVERKEYYEQLDEVKSKLDLIKDENQKIRGGSNLRSAEDIEKRMQFLELRLITERITPSDEKSIASEMLTLRGKMNQITEMEENNKKQKSMDELFKELKPKIAELSKKISEMGMKRDSIKNELNKLAEARDEKPPAVQNLEARIAELKEKKQELIKKKEEKREEIKKADEEYAIFEKELDEQKKLEAKKKLVREAIDAIVTKKEALLSDLESMDPNKFDVLIYTLNSMKKVEPFMVDADLAGTLLKFQVDIPNGPSEVDRTIGSLIALRDGLQDEFKNRLKKIANEVAILDAEIASEKSKLGEMPPTNYDVLRRGGFRETNKNRV